VGGTGGGASAMNSFEGGKSYKTKKVPPSRKLHVRNPTGRSRHRTNRLPRKTDRRSRRAKSNKRDGGNARRNGGPSKGANKGETGPQPFTSRKEAKTTNTVERRERKESSGKKGLNNGQRQEREVPCDSTGKAGEKPKQPTQPLCSRQFERTNPERLMENFGRKGQAGGK